jgi:hypothetical protein
MQPATAHAFKLQIHPTVTAPEVRSLNARLEFREDGALQLRYLLDAHVPRLRVPPPAAASRTDELWKHTCFEAFVKPHGAAFYYEINLSPSSQWALYRFDSYREGMRPVEAAKPPAISVQSSDFRLELRAVVNLDDLPELRDSTHLDVALAAVIESADGRVSYWALRHPAEKPDFHHTDSFVSVLR